MAIQFDPTRNDLTVVGIDSGAGVTGNPRRTGDSELRGYAVVDAAGNGRTVLLRVHARPDRLAAEVVSLRYGSGRTMVPPQIALTIDLRHLARGPDVNQTRIEANAKQTGPAATYDRARQP